MFWFVNVVSPLKSVSCKVKNMGITLNRSNFRGPQTLLLYYGKKATWKLLNGRKESIADYHGRKTLFKPCGHDDDDTKTMVILQPALVFKKRWIMTSISFLHSHKMTHRTWNRGIWAREKLKFSTTRMCSTFVKCFALREVIFSFLRFRDVMTKP